MPSLRIAFCDEQRARICLRGRPNWL